MSTGASQRPPSNRSASPEIGCSRRGELVLAAITAVAAAALFTARLTGFPAFTPFTQILAFYPLVSATAVVLAIVAAVFRGWIVCSCLALTALVIVATSWPASAEPVAAPAGSVSVRVVSSNVNVGAATAPLINRLAAEPNPVDLVFIAECNTDCGQILNRPPATTLFPYRRIADAPGAGGSAILSRSPLTDLPTQPQVPGQFAMPNAEVELGGVPVAVKTAHPFPPMIFDLGRWRSGLDELADFSAAAKSATIIGGDFNATPYHDAFRSVLGDRLHDAIPATAGTWPSEVPPLVSTPIDHILFSAPFVMSASGTWNLESSDHRTVWADLWLSR